MSAQQFGNRKRQFLENASSAFEKPDTSEEERIAELEMMMRTADHVTGNCEKSLQHLTLNFQQKREIVMELRTDYPMKDLCDVLDCVVAAHIISPGNQTMLSCARRLSDR